MRVRVPVAVRVPVPVPVRVPVTVRAPAAGRVRVPVPMRVPARVHPARRRWTRRRSGRRPRWPVLAAVAVAACLAGAVLALLVRAWTGEDPDAVHQTVEQLGDDRVRVEASAGDRTVAIVGPASVPVGGTASFTAEAEGVEGIVWLAPDGQVHADDEGLDVSTRTEGRAAITLVGVDAQGRRVEARHPLRVVG